MIIGTFKKDAQADGYTGHITTLTFQRNQVQLVANEKGSDKEPDYRVVGNNGSGTVEFGAAWRRTSEKGQEFLSVSIDDPALPGALNAALFDAEHGDTASLVWTRPKAKAAVKDASAKSKKN
jgi:uncharacterized protein (DUF736 family)